MFFSAPCMAINSAVQVWRFPGDLILAYHGFFHWGRVNLKYQFALKPGMHTGNRIQVNDKLPVYFKKNIGIKLLFQVFEGKINRILPFLESNRECDFLETVKIGYFFYWHLEPAFI